MALILNLPTVKKKKSSFDYHDWYLQNKKRLSDKRKKLYQENNEYREAALRRSRNQKPKVVAEIDPQGYVISLNEAARRLELSIWTLREWRKKDYFPEPVSRNGRLWFNEAQLNLLHMLKGFFAVSGARISASNKESLQQTVSLIYSNW